MTRAIKYVVDLKPTHILILGDFNFREIDWNNEETSVGKDHLATIFLESVRDTHFINMSKNLQDIDLITFRVY